MMNPKKSLSQNFLKDKNISKKIISETKIKNNLIFEIGPGYGSLTDMILMYRPKKLVLIEKDEKLYKYLKNKYFSNKNITVLNKDILEFDFSGYRDFIIISNLPYNISSKIILYLFQNSVLINEMVLMIQKEMAIKFDYNLKKMNKYKFLNKLFCSYKRCFDVSPNVFLPKPKVTSTVVKFKFLKNNIDFNKAINFSQKIFKNKRKKIINNLKLKELEGNDILEKRIDQLTISDLMFIYNFF